MSDAPLRTVARNTTRHHWQLSTASKCKSRIRSLYSSKGFWIKSRLQVQYLHKIGQLSLFLFLLEFPDLWVYILAKNQLIHMALIQKERFFSATKAREKKRKRWTQIQRRQPISSQNKEKNTLQFKTKEDNNI